MTRIFALVALFLHLSLFACPFCNVNVLTKQFVHETERTVTLYCNTPATKGNLLIIPKRHVERFEELIAEEMLDIQEEINLLSRAFADFYGISEFVLIQKNGVMAGQSVLHLHFHMIPAPKPFNEIVRTAFGFREKISDEEMKLRTEELREFLLMMERL